MRQDEAAASALLELFLFVCVCVYSKSGLLYTLSVHIQYLNHVSFSCHYSGWRSLPAPYWTMMQLDCCLQHAMNFWRNAALPLNCSTTESPRTQKLFSYLALLQNGNFCNKGRIISHTRSYCNAHSCYCLSSLIPVLLMKAVRTKFTWQGKRTSSAEKSLWSSPLHVRYTQKSLRLISLQNTWKKHQCCRSTHLGQQGCAFPVQGIPHEEFKLYPKDEMEHFTWLKTTASKRSHSTTLLTQKLQMLLNVPIMSWKHSCAGTQLKLLKCSDDL